LACVVCANHCVHRIQRASIHVLSPPYPHPVLSVSLMPFTVHILLTCLMQQVMLFAFYFFLRKKEQRLAQQI
jgi:hypothetical protein